MQQEHGQKPDEDDGERAEGGVLEQLQARISIDVRGEGLEIEGPQQQGGGQLLHGVDEYEQRRGAERWGQQGNVHAPERR
jgi:hypothetical protein